MTKTYSEERQRILFKTARDLRKVAASVLDDCTDAGAGISKHTVRWAIDLAGRTAVRANELESEAHEQCVATQAQETRQFKSREDYRRSIDAFEARVRKANGLSYTESPVAWVNEHENRFTYCAGYHSE